MLIIRSGKYKNKRLKEVDPSITRPSKDILKEGLFNIINLKIKDSSFLDIYGGSGQIGIEAISRGAKKVVINDINKKAIKIINENVKSLNGSDDIKIENLSDIDLLNKYKDNNFDIIFIDPPYIYNNEINILSLLKNNNIINKYSLIFYEKECEIDESLSSLYNIKKYKYGRSLLFLLTLKE